MDISLHKLQKRLKVFLRVLYDHVEGTVSQIVYLRSNFWFYEI